MKTFSDLRAIESQLDIEIATKSGVIRLRWPLMANIDFSCEDPVSVKIDGLEVLQFGYQSQGFWRITLHEPFYRWRHHVTGQGWLLEPARASALGCGDS